MKSASSHMQFNKQLSQLHFKNMHFHSCMHIECYNYVFRLVMGHKYSSFFMFSIDLHVKLHFCLISLKLEFPTDFDKVYCIVLRK